MPELSKDLFRDTMARALFSRESPLDHHLHVIDHPHSSHVHQQQFFHDSASSPVQYIGPGMSTFPPLSLSDPDYSSRHSTNCFPLEIDAAYHQQQHTQQQQQFLGQSGPGFTPNGVPRYRQASQLEVPEIEDCSSWMGYVLDDFLNFSTPELSPLGFTTKGSFDGIPPVPDFSSPIRLPLSQPQPQQQPAVYSSWEDEVAPSHQPISPPTTLKRSPGAFSPRRVKTPEDVSSLLPTPKPLKPGGSRRGRRVAENLKKVSNVEQLDHVKRERQRRDDMSLKVSTLECLLPPAVPNFKRDRVTIVHDSVHYVKSLQEKVEELKNKWVELKLKKRTRAALRCDVVTVRNPELAACSSKSHFVEYNIQVEGEGEGGARLEKCRCGPDFMSSAMKVLEVLNLDVCRCTITKMFDYVIFVIVAKPRLTSSQVAASASVVSAFRSSLQLL